MKKHLNNLLYLITAAFVIIGLKLISMIQMDMEYFDELMFAFNDLSIWVIFYRYLMSILAVIIIVVPFYLLYLLFNYLINKIIVRGDKS